MKNDEPCVSYTINGKAEALVSIFTGMLENNPYLAIVMKKALENFGRNQLLARAKGGEAN